MTIYQATDITRVPLNPIYQRNTMAGEDACKAIPSYLMFIIISVREGNYSLVLDFFVQNARSLSLYWPQFSGRRFSWFQAIDMGSVIHALTS